MDEDPKPTELTALLNRAVQGDQAAAETVFTEVYQELRRLAAIQRGRLRPTDTLPTAAVVNEAYLRLLGRQNLQWNDRHHFFCTAARAMRDILVEDARRRAAKKRGGSQHRVTLDNIEGEIGTSDEQLIELDMALKKLEQDTPENAQLVLLRYFGGLTMDEIADVLQTSLRSVERRWRFCRAWLARELDANT